MAARRGGRVSASLSRLLGVEKKYVDLANVSDTLSSPADAAGGEVDPGVGALNAIAQGDGETNRDGRKCVLTHVAISGNIVEPVLAGLTTGNTNTLVFIALVLDKQTNGAAISSEDVFTNPGASSFTACNVFRNLKFIQRFDVLKTLLIETNHSQLAWDGTDLESGATITPFKFNMMLPNIQCTYMLDTQAIAAIVDNSLHMIAFMVNPAATTAPTINYNSRVRFVG